MRRIPFTAATVIALIALAVPAALAAGGAEDYRGFSGYATTEGEVYLTSTPASAAGVGPSTCAATYCARWKAGRKDRHVTVTVMDDATDDVLFAVGQDKNGDGDAIDAGEYALGCGIGSFAVRPKKNVDIQVLWGVWRPPRVELDLGHEERGTCVSAPAVGTITARFSR